MQLRLILLGSGQDGGRPQMGTPATGAQRSASSIALVSDLWAPLLFDATPDLRSQYRLLSEHIQPRGGEFEAVFLTHAHMGHYAGLVHFGKEAANTSSIPLYADVTVLDFLSANEPWASLFTNGNLTPMPIPDGGVALDPVVVTPIPVPHRGEFTTTSAFSIVVDGSPWALYLPDIDDWAAWPEAADVIASHELCLLDATFGSADELPDRRISDIPHPLVTDTVERFEDLIGGTQIVLTHLNHSNALNDPNSTLSALVHASGFTVGADGMVFPHGDRL